MESRSSDVGLDRDGVGRRAHRPAPGCDPRAAPAVRCDVRSAASARAVASPMPEEAPVMTATRPALFSVLDGALLFALLSGLASLWHPSARSERPCQRGTKRAPLSGTVPAYVGVCERDQRALAIPDLPAGARSRPSRPGCRPTASDACPAFGREEVASLAGVSVEYYKRLERGNATGASDAVLDALADALRLDDAECAHLFDLARAVEPNLPAAPTHAGPAARPPACAHP